MHSLPATFLPAPALASALVLALEGAVALAISTLETTAEIGSLETFAFGVTSTSTSAFVFTSTSAFAFTSAGSSSTIATAVVALKTITLALGGVITYFAFNAYRRTGARPIGALALGFGFVTLGALLAGAAHQAFGLDADLVVLLESALTVVGFGVITYSLYGE